MSERVITPAEVATWQRCRRRWYLQHYRGLTRKARPLTHPQAVAKRVHAALFTYYTPTGVSAMHTDPVAYVRAAAAVDLETYPEYAYDIEAEAGLAVAMVEGYLEWCETTGADEGFTVEAEPLTTGVAIAPGLRLQVRQPPQVRDHDGEVFYLDSLTPSSLAADDTTLQMDAGTLSSHLVEYLQQPTGDRAAGTKLNLLRRVKRTATAKPPFYDRREIRHNETELHAHWQHVLAIAGEIAAATDALDRGGDNRHQTVAYPNPTRDCHWDCPFYAICPHMDDGSGVEALIDERYEHPLPMAPSASWIATTEPSTELPAEPAHRPTLWARLFGHTR